MKIVNNTKKLKCIFCRLPIEEKRKVKHSSKTYGHISCSYNWVMIKFNRFRKMKNHLAKYKKNMVLEKLK